MAEVSTINLWEWHPRVAESQPALIVGALQSHVYQVRHARDRQREDDEVRHWHAAWRQHPKLAKSSRSAKYSSVLGRIGMVCSPKAKRKPFVPNPEHAFSKMYGPHVSISDLLDMLKTGSITADDFPILAADVNRFELEGLSNNGVISADSCKRLKNDLDGFEVKNMRSEGYLSEIDLQMLKVDFCRGCDR